jgi:hypothetical protein
LFVLRKIWAFASFVVVLYLILTILSPTPVISTLIKSNTSTGNSQLSPSTVGIKFRIYGLENNTRQVLIFLTAHNVTKGRTLDPDGVSVLLKASGGKYITTGLRLPSYLLEGGDKFRACVMELERIKLVCATSEYKPGGVSLSITIFMNSTEEVNLIPNIWKSVG